MLFRQSDLVREACSDKVTFEKRPEEVREQDLRIPEGGAIQVEGARSPKFLCVGVEGGRMCLTVGEQQGG